MINWLVWSTPRITKIRKSCKWFGRGWAFCNTTSTGWLELCSSLPIKTIHFKFLHRSSCSWKTRISQLSTPSKFWSRTGTGSYRSGRHHVGQLTGWQLKEDLRQGLASISIVPRSNFWDDRWLATLSKAGSYVCCIYGHAHRMAYMAHPTTKFWVKKVEDPAVSQAKTSTPCKPITLRILHKLVTATQLDMPEYEATLMRAIFSMAFHTCARTGEMVCSNGQPKHPILTQNVVIGPGQVAITSICFKHHRDGAPVTRVLQAASKEVWSWTGTLFVWLSGRPVEASEVRLSLHRCLERAGDRHHRSDSTQFPHWISVQSGRQRSLRYPAVTDRQVEEHCLDEVCQAH